MSLKRERAWQRLKKKSQRGFRGYPVGTVSFFGPDQQLATQAVATIVRHEGAAPVAVKRWHSDGEIREDGEVLTQILGYLNEYDPPSLAMLDQVVGCPHEEGVDYPHGEPCPQCPAWKDKEQLTI